jgi:hypothetical protein
MEVLAMARTKLIKKMTVSKGRVGRVRKNPLKGFGPKTKVGSKLKGKLTGVTAGRYESVANCADCDCWD